MFATSSCSSLGRLSNQASRISLSTGALVARSDNASTFASFQRRAPRAVSASPHRAARTPATLFAAIDAPVPVQQHTTAWSAQLLDDRLRDADALVARHGDPHRGARAVDIADSVVAPANT